MLKQLIIKNFALIDTLDIHFHPGFSVITGETGAGKSIILGAINLLLGQRADLKSIKSGCTKCTVEAHFDIKNYKLKSFFEENDIDYDAEDCILRRELNITGKSRAFINDTPVSLSIIKNIGQQLIDIHSQHQNLLLNEEDFQLHVIDILAKNNTLLSNYNDSFKNFMTAKNAVIRLKTEIEENKRNEDFLRFQLNELNDAKLQNGMQEELEQEREKLNHIEEIKTAIFDADNTLNSDQYGNGGIIDKLRDATKSLENISDIFNEIKPIINRMESCYIELKDISQEIGNMTDDIDYNPEKLGIIDSQLDKIYTLEQKHHVSSVEELICIQEEKKKQLNKIENSDYELEALIKNEEEWHKQCKKYADKLTAIRKKTAKTIEKEISNRLSSLGMPNVSFLINITKKEPSHNGCDNVSFLFSANTNTPMQAISQIASGGEIARVMLAIKAMISGAVNLPTIIFDEIDTGVSGVIAEKMGGIMNEMSQPEKQVISITHLPQIAARGMTHYKVYKDETNNGTISHMIQLNDKERINEIAQMLSGSEVTSAAINNAKVLLKSKQNV